MRGEKLNLESPNSNSRRLEEVLTSKKQDLIISYYDKGIAIKEIARRIGCDRNTVRSYIRGKEKKISPRSDSGKFLEENKQKLIILFYSCECRCVPFKRKIKNEYGVDIHIKMLQRFFKETKDAYKAQTREITKRFESLPGQQLQMDFFEKDVVVKKIPTRLHVFVGVLGYSRVIFAKAYFVENADSWKDGLESNFYFIGGVPVRVVTDNTIHLMVIRGKMDEGEGTQTKYWKEEFVFFSEHYGFIPSSTAVRKPRSKGKVERAVQYVENNALVGEEFDSIEDVNIYLEKWCISILDEKIDVLIPGPNTRRERFEIEKQKLMPIAPPKIARLNVYHRIVSKDCLIRINNKFYKLPDAYACKDAQVYESETTISVSYPKLESVEFDKAKGIYTPEMQMASDSQQDPAQSKQQKLDNIYKQLEEKDYCKEYQTNPYNRKTSDYDEVVNWKKEEEVANGTY